MPTFDPSKPVNASLINAVELRDQFNSLKTLIDTLPPDAPSGPAGGDLGGSFPNPTVTSIAHVTTGPATYPAGDGSLLTNLPAPATLKSGSGTLDGSGILILPSLPGVSAVVAGWLNAAGSGVLFNNTFSSIQSTAGAADAGAGVNWIGF